jgi:hypothetical protein
VTCAPLLPSKPSVTAAQAAAHVRFRTRAPAAHVGDEAQFVSEVHSGHVVLATVLCHRWVARAGAHPQFGRLGERGVPVHAIVVGGIEDDEFVIYDPWSGPLRIDVDTFLHLEFGFWSGQAYAF